MRLYIDKERCSGHGRCYTLSPEVVEADDEGFPVHRGQEIFVGADIEEAAQLAAANCPESAITLAD